MEKNKYIRNSQSSVIRKPPIEKTGKRSEQLLHKEYIYIANKHTEKMLNTISH